MIVYARVCSNVDVHVFLCVYVCMLVCVCVLRACVCVRMVVYGSV